MNTIVTNRGAVRIKGEIYKSPNLCQEEYTQHSGTSIISVNHDVARAGIREEFDAYELPNWRNNPDLVRVSEGFEDKAVVTVNQPPPQHDWSQAKARLAELREEFAGLEPVTFRATVAIEGEVSWNLSIPKMPRKDARELRRLVQNYVADLSLNLERKITVQGNASTLSAGEP